MSERTPCYVVGSGPAGVTCAGALLDQGLEVTLIDAGVDLEPERRETVQRLARSGPEGWSEDDLRSLREGMQAGAKGIPLKRIYGSDFPYREVSRHAPLRCHGVDAAPSLARGGFGNVWGAVVAPWVEDDLAGWPDAAKPRSEHYEAVLRGVDFSAVEDGLASFVPLHCAEPRPLRPCRQAEAFLTDAGAHRPELERAGIHVGRSRLAVRAGPGKSDQGCVYCGLCLYGCPYGLIFNPRSALERLQHHPRFRYVGDVVVDRLEETEAEVRLHGHSRLDDSPFVGETERVYLACGTYATTRILLASLEVHDEPVTIRDSQYFLLPLLRYRATAGVEYEKLHTLAQAFLEIRDPAVTRHTVHCELFGYNDMLEGAATSRLGPAAPLLRPAVRAFVRRVLVGQCFLHSDDSPTIEARLLPSDGPRGTLVLRGNRNDDTSRAVGRVWRKLMGHRRELRAVPVPPLIEIAAPGRGYHSGGSFPMRSEPGRLESDVWGRPFGLRRVHAVDASVCPTVPATTITLPVMANAQRIAAGFRESAP